jgi:hypothetical protein
MTALETEPTLTVGLAGNAATVTGAPAGEATEASWLPRIVAILTPFFTVFAGWFASWVGQHTGVKLDQTQMAALMVAAATSAFGASWKWLHGWQQHEQLVAQGLDVPRKPGPNAPAPATPR